ncbi:MAG: hypothetical protein BWY11_01227 [Firmicutes bacterium ADurb.Bin182]|nr:MAG: hypothetical protein BWY11_01227 [Firmicutes bacterium ADurb.Bin182]
MKRGFAYFMSTVSSLLLIIAILFTCLQVAVNDEEWFYLEYQKLGTGRLIGMTLKDMVNSVMRLVDYMEGRVPDINIDVEFKGETREMFNERESAHMLDVRALYQTFRRIRNISVLAAALMLTLSSLLVRRDTPVVFSKSLLTGGSIFLAVAAALGLWIFIDFGSFWTRFHLIFFTNDLWLLDPSVDRMILICPEQLFFDIIARFGGWFLIVVSALALSSILCLAVRRHRHNTRLILKRKK